LRARHLLATVGTRAWCGRAVTGVSAFCPAPPIHRLLRAAELRVRGVDVIAFVESAQRDLPIAREIEPLPPGVAHLVEFEGSEVLGCTARYSSRGSVSGSMHSQTQPPQLSTRTCDSAMLSSVSLSSQSSRSRQNVLRPSMSQDQPWKRQ
jgi:hypothetical protein